MRDLKELVDTGALGTVPHIKTHFSGNVAGRYKPRHCHIAPCESPAGGLAGSGIHSTDAITHLAGAITEVYAVTTKREHELDMDDTTMVTFKLASGAVAPLLAITASTPTWRIVFYGTKGKARAGVAADRRGAETLRVSLVTGDRQSRSYAPFDIERAELEAFADAITGRAPYTVAADELLNGAAAFEAVPLSAARSTPLKI